MKASSSLRLKILGGCREQGRSCFLLEAEGQSWLLDCGVKRVLRGDSVGEYPLLDAIDVSSLKAVVLSHGHEDHSAALPLLYKRGFDGEVWCTAPTARLAAEYCRSWLSNVKRHSAELPYGDSDIDRVRFATCGYGEEIDLGIKVKLLPAGHLVGAALCLIELSGRQLLYTGDVAYESRLLPDPAGWDRANALILDGSCGVESLRRDDAEARLLALVSRTATVGGSVLVPLPRYGRTQELLVSLYEHRAELPPIYVEENLRKACETYIEYRDWLRPGGAELLGEALASGAFRYVGSREERVVALRCTPALILASDAMLSSGASLEYLRVLAAGPENLVVMTGHAAEGTTAAKLLDGERVIDEAEGPIDVRLGIASVPLKIHPDRDESLALASCTGGRAVVAHSSAKAAEDLAALIRGRGGAAIAPDVGTEIKLF